MTKFSLIIPTVGRTEELEKMLGSLANQQPADFELIVVDQNDDNRVERLFSVLTPDIAVSHLRLSRKSLYLLAQCGLKRGFRRNRSFPG